MTLDNRLISSDTDAFRNNGTIYTDSITFSGNLAASSTQTQTSNGINVANMDYFQVLYDNSIQSSGKFRDIGLENRTYILETTGNSYLLIVLRINVISGVLTITGTVLNAYSSIRALQTTTINIRVVAYDNTIV